MNATNNVSRVRTLPADPDTVLMVDDDPSVLAMMSEMLQLAGYRVTTCLNGREALQCFEDLQPNIVILDMRMPELDGLGACRVIRAKSDVPILMLTAIDDQWDAAHALESGADDYIRKPIGAGEFVARVRAAIRRSAPPVAELPGPITIGHIVIDPSEHEVRVEGKSVELSPIELRLLILMATSQNHVLTHEDILTAVWGVAYSSSRHVLRVTMSRLRRKLGLTDAGTVGIATVEGVGYRLVVREAAAQVPSEEHHEVLSRSLA